MPECCIPATVLPDSAFSSSTEARAKGPTHEVVSQQPYYLRAPSDVQERTKADGHFPKGAKVWLLSRGEGAMCQVQDEAGKQVMTALSGLRKLR
jgi:hypothetical protein